MIYLLIYSLQSCEDFLQNIIASYSNAKFKINEIVWKVQSYITNSNDNLVHYKDIYKGTSKLVIMLPNILVKDVIEHFYNKMLGVHLGVHKVYYKIRARDH